LSELKGKYTLCLNVIVFSEVFVVYLKAITEKKELRIDEESRMVLLFLSSSSMDFPENKEMF